MVQKTKSNIFTNTNANCCFSMLLKACKNIGTHKLVQLDKASIMENHSVILKSVTDYLFRIQEGSNHVSARSITDCLWMFEILAANDACEFEDRVIWDQYLTNVRYY